MFRFQKYADQGASEMLADCLFALFFNSVNGRNLSFRIVGTHLECHNSEDHSMSPLLHNALGCKREEQSVYLITQFHMTLRLGMHGANPLVPTSIHSVLRN
jgi:hypothetical protein